MASFFSSQRGNTKTSTESTTYEHVLGDDFTKEKEEVEKPMESTNATHKEMAPSCWPTPRTMSKKRKPRRKKKKTHGCSTVSMRKHHHATYAHLIHDALIRLRCSPTYHYGFSKRAIARNIERHYRLKLGKKFKLRLQISLTKLVGKGRLIPHGKKRSGIKYRASQTFLKHFGRLKVIDGAANRHFGVKIGNHCCKRGRSRSSSSGSKSRSQSRIRSRNSNKSQSQCRRRKIGTKSQVHSQSQRQWKHWKGKHKENRSNKSRSQSWSREKDATIASSEKAASGDGLSGWFWPPKEEKIQDKDSDEELPSQLLGNTEQQEFLESYNNNKRKREDDGGEKRYRKFKRIRISEKSSDEGLSPEYDPLPKISHEASEADSYYSRTSEVDSQSSHDSLGYMEPSSRNSENDSKKGIYNPTNGKMEDIDEEDANADAMRETSRSKSCACWNSNMTMRQLKEHNMLHSMKSSSAHSSSNSRRTFRERISDTLCGAFGTQPTSFATEQASPLDLKILAILGTSLQGVA